MIHFFKTTDTYWMLPINNNANLQKIEFYEDGTLLYDLDVRLDPVSPTYYAYPSMKRWIGKTLDILCEGMPELNATFVATMPDTIYQEKYRPQVHFTTKQGWTNDPNGLVYANGCYHLFYQYNPAGTTWGNMHWGHATSMDLLHWKEEEIALYPDEWGTMYSGSAIVVKDAMLLYYTAAGSNSKLSAGKPFTQCLAYSSDGGYTFQKYKNNPILPHRVGGNRDPKIIFCEELHCYVLALYHDGNEYGLYTSNTLVSWDLLQKFDLPKDSECPDFYPLNANGDPTQRKWIFSGASDFYLVGSFQNGLFVPEQEEKQLHRGKNSYAAQTYSNIENRRIRIAWNTSPVPDSIFNMSMGIPSEMTLRYHDGEYFLCTYPIEEVKRLYKDSVTYTGKAYDISAIITNDTTLNLFGISIVCDFSNQMVLCMGSTTPLLLDENGNLKLRILIDTLSMELYVNDGEGYLCNAVLPDYTQIPVSQETIQIHEFQ